MLSLVKEMRKKVSFIPDSKKGITEPSRGTKEVFISGGAPPGS